MNDNEVTVIPDSNALQVLARSEIDCQVATANQYPRSVKAFLDEAITLATLDTDTALSCFYAYSRGGKKIAGPGIRVAEMAASAYRNLRAEARIVEIGEKTIVAKGTCIDLEKNVAMSSEVSRKICDKNGKRFSEDMITMTANATSKIALRNAIFSVIPKAFINKIYEAARATALGNADSMEKKRKNCIDVFKAMHVEEKTLLSYLGLAHVEDIELSDLDVLLSIWRSVKAGETTVEKAFAPKAGSPEVGKVKLEDVKKPEEELPDPSEPYQEPFYMPSAEIFGEIQALVEVNKLSPEQFDFMTQKLGCVDGQWQAMTADKIDTLKAELEAM